MHSDFDINGVEKKVLPKPKQTHIVQMNLWSATIEGKIRTCSMVPYNTEAIQNLLQARLNKIAEEFDAHTKMHLTLSITEIEHSTYSKEL